MRVEAQLWVSARAKTRSEVRLWSTTDLDRPKNEDRFALINGDIDGLNARA